MWGGGGGGGPSGEALACPGEAIRETSGRVIGAAGLCAGPGLAARLRAEAADVAAYRRDGAEIRAALEAAGGAEGWRDAISAL